ncbi:MAG: restriction endonuclease [Desulfobacula sp.]|jgi:restriction system protein|nr:restriction endonuclease [Desulfobacula sp.]
MAVPDFQSFFSPMLDIANDDKEHSLKETRQKLAGHFNLTEDDLGEYLPSGTQTKFDNRVAWAKSYLIQAKVLESPRRAYFKITERGKELHLQSHEKITVKILNQYPEFVEFHSPKSNSTPDPKPHHQDIDVIETPEEILQKAYHSIRNDLEVELLDNIKTNTPDFFERLVVDFMVAMGYGGSRRDAGKSVGRSGDEGIDGIIKEDRLGLDVIYLQAKRWEGTVGRPEIQKFVGALHGKRAKKGVFITTGKFSQEATDYVKIIDPKVILIDGRDLAGFMIDFNLGTSTNAVYEVKRIDTDYFVED